jgi:hypothetical protein
VTTVYPFKDRPDQGIQVLFYPVPPDTPYVPFAHPFVLRNWDRLEELPIPILGTRYDAKKYYFGQLPINLPGPICGAEVDWQNGLLYSTYIADGYACACPAMIFPSGPTYDDTLDARAASIADLADSGGTVPTYDDTLDARAAKIADLQD